MRMSEVQDYARQLMEQFGDKAELIAAQKAQECQKQGDEKEASDWRRIRTAVREMRTPHVS